MRPPKNTFLAKHDNVGVATGDATVRFVSYRDAKETHAFQHVRDNASFSEVVGMLNDALVVAEGLEQMRQTNRKHKS